MGPLVPGFAVGISIEIMQSKPRRVILAVLTIVIGFPMALVAGILPHVFPLGPDSLPRDGQVSPGVRRLESQPALKTPMWFFTPLRVEGIPGRPGGSHLPGGSPGTRRMTSTPATSCGTFSSSIRSKWT